MSAQVQTGSAHAALLQRCDRCGAEAKFEVVTPSGNLLFCGHHGYANAEVLADRYPILPLVR